MSYESRVNDAINTERAPDAGSTEGHAQNIPCTKAGGASCRLLKHRRGLNEILLHACLELREDWRGKSRGDALIAVVEASTCGHALYGSEEDSCKSKALHLVERLVAEHRCITAIEFNGCSTYHPSLLSAVKRHGSLKSVAVCGKFLASGDAAFMCEVIKSLPQLERLAFKVHDFEKDWGIKIGLCGSSFELGMHYLTTLDVAVLSMSPSEARRLIHALIDNQTVTDIAVGQCVFGYRDEASNALFASYLAKEGSTLKIVTLKSNAFSDRESLLRELIDAFCKMNTLEELNADIVVMNAEFVGAVALFAKVASQSTTLRSLRLPSTFCECRASFWCPSAQLPDLKAAQCMDPWLTALRRQDSLLNKLCIDLRGFGEAECHAFFGAVADTDALRSVVVLSLPGIDRIDRVCRTIQERGLNDRVVIHGHYMHSNTQRLQQCPRISSATIRASHFLCSEGVGLQPVISALEVVGGCAHITSLRVNCDRFDRKAFSALAACVRAPSTLTDVNIDFGYVCTLLTEQDRRDVQGELVRALASNLKLVRLNIKGVLLSNDDFKWLADSASKSLSLMEFTLTPACVFSARHGQMYGEVRSCSLHKAEALTGASNEKDIALADIMEATRKNASAVSAAARFVLGEEDGIEGARSIELMHNHPRLLEMVRESADVTKADAKKIISSALLRLRHCSLHEYMRMVGVVKETVECLAVPGTSFQLSDINPYCWLHIRSFLKIADVLQPRAGLRRQSPPAELSSIGIEEDTGGPYGIDVRLNPEVNKSIL
ncbi:hypothetical protein HPB49_022118 [Dermacentor silvarum]|uniref:Uncharacterized protein n=1 Tax=Dermacentor silvarum TaxID=543639 RepID=A0ACB8CTE0_DERSI|nr:uncharacterized protein LOC119452351 [Dermacentor silvarum]KAH7950300.1 hypothetical protein HPB49_022118 [Dermacentor silvarum]